MIPYSRQSISREDMDAVISVLESDFLTQGPATTAFEQALCDYSQCPHAIAVNSGTSALHIACIALGLSEGDRLWTSPITFVASANCGRYCGAQVDFVDIDPQTGNMSIDALKTKLKQAQHDNTLPKVVVPVHFAGHPCDMPAIHALSKQYGFHIIEDASHALGAEQDGEKIGHAKYADVTIFSFHPVKMITTAEGGAAMTRQAELAQRMSMLRTHGITKHPDYLEKKDEGGWHYEQHFLGWNYRMSDLHAALGLSQIKQLDSFVQKRRALASRYHTRLKELPVTTPPNNDHASWHLYRIGIQERRSVYDYLQQSGYGVQVHYIPVHLQPYYQKLGFKAGDFPQAETFYAEGLSIPLYQDFQYEEQDAFIQTLSKALQP